MDATAYRSLSPRELECLRLVAQGLTSKQIAARLSLTPDTVDGYVKSAMRKLGASDRKTAARQVASVEGSLPQWLGEPAVGGGELEPPPAAPASASDGKRAAIRLPIRRRGERSNELGILARLLWIPGIAVVLAIAFGMLSVGLKVLSDLFGSSPLLTRSAQGHSIRADSTHHPGADADRRVAPQPGR